MKVYTTYARADARSGRDLEQIRAFESNSSMAKNRILGSVGRIPSLLASNHQSKRSFSTAATGAFQALEAVEVKHEYKRYAHEFFFLPSFV